MKALRLKSSPLRWALICTSVVLAGCAAPLPRSERPAAPIASQYADATDVQGTAAAQRGWRDFFSDPLLQNLIE
ncbi:MAG: multidrug transporter, partial [Betaproteobacteria bacterium]